MTDIKRRSFLRGLAVLPAAVIGAARRPPADAKTILSLHHGDSRLDFTHDETSDTWDITPTRSNTTATFWYP